jgi:hypothetical protein
MSLTYACTFSQTYATLNNYQRRNISRRASMLQARLIRQLDKQECAQRNALTCKPDGLVLGAGALGTVIDTLDSEAFLIEFGSRGPNECDWLGVLYASELQLIAELAKAA